MVKELVTRFGTSAETIRRDLSALSFAGKLQKTHGGAVLPRIAGEGLFQQRMGENTAAKRQIAKKACSLILPGETLFIDTGSTTLSFAEELTAIDSLTIITNSADIVRVVAANKSSQIFLLGGTYSADNRETIGPMAISQIRKFRVDHTILTIGALHAKAGITDFNNHEALIAEAMIEQTESVIVLADSSKFGQIAPYQIANLDQISCLVSEAVSSDALTQALEEANVRLILTS